MGKKNLTSLDRVFTTMGHNEPDRVPLFLSLTIYGAKELQIPIREYLSCAENVVRGQLLMREKYKHDNASAFFYGTVEYEAWGGEVVFRDNGPPNSTEPILRSIQQISHLEIPKFHEQPCLRKVLEATKLLREYLGVSAPIVGVVISPFSQPVLQLGFEQYLQLLYFDRDSFNMLMRVNEEFCVNWANAQLGAGATAICYFDPLASPTIIEKELYMETGYPVARRTLKRIKGPTAVHLASGITLPVMDEIINTGTSGLGISSKDPLDKIKESAREKVCLIGNLNALDMVNWLPGQVEERVKSLIAGAGPGGGFILSEDSGEIPWSVSEDILMEISEAVQRWGNYPLHWVEDYEEA